MTNMYPELIITCNDFQNGETIPVKYTHRGEEISPEFVLQNLSPKGKTIAIIFDDLDHPMNHWAIWNIPAMNIIPESRILQNIEKVRQKNPYRGPNPPKGIRHKYQFNVYVLDCELPSKKFSRNQLVAAIEGHVIQYGFINGYFE